MIVVLTYQLYVKMPYTNIKTFLYRKKNKWFTMAGNFNTTSVRGLNLDFQN